MKNGLKIKTSPWQQQPQWQLQTRSLGFLQLCPLSQWNSPPKRTLTSLNVNKILVEYQLQSTLLCWYGLLVIKVGSWKCFCSTSLKRESIKKILILLKNCCDILDYCLTSTLVAFVEISCQVPVESFSQAQQPSGTCKQYFRSQCICLNKSLHWNLGCYLCQVLRTTLMVSGLNVTASQSLALSTPQHFN